MGWHTVWQFRVFEKSTYFFTADNLVFFSSLLASESSLCGKKPHPSGAWSSLKLTLYVICKANCNHRDHFCCHSQSPLKFLSLCLVLWVLPFLLFSLSLLSSIYFAFNVPLFLFFYSCLSLCRLILFPSPLSLSPSLSWSFLVLLFRCHFPSLQHFFFFCHFFIGSCLFAHRHRHTRTHRHTHPLSLKSLKSERIWFPKSTQKKVTGTEYSPCIVSLEITLAHLA